MGTKRTDDDDSPPPPGVKRWIISCDESGTGGKPFYGFGSLWSPDQRRGDFAAMITDLRERYRYPYEIKWNKVNDANLKFYKALVESFFKTNYLAFHCLVVRMADVDLTHHSGSWDLARQKHFTRLLTNKIQRCLTAYPERAQTFRIWVDPIQSSYGKADEVVEIIANHVLKKLFGQVRSVDRVFTRDSKDTPSIGLCDVLLGAVMETWQKDSQREAKVELRQWIADHLGWPSLNHDTHKNEVKFNVWYFYDPTAGAPRAVKTEPVKLKYPLPQTVRRASNR
ncbi:MAG: DUF3800 domain-containing protein [Deltaproteobacteria bacterium]|nr:DUF3800 domain-containing protein [Deltaproteobacteria bacterium]